MLDNLLIHFRLELQSHTPERRKDAARALVESGDPRAFDILIAALDDSPEDLRDEYLNDVLYQLVDARAVPALLGAFMNSATPDWLRTAAVIALRKAGDGQLVEPLLEAVRDTEGTLRQNILASITNLVDKHAVPALINALRSRQVDVRRAAADALRKIDWQPADMSQRFWQAFAEESVWQLTAGGADALKWLSLATDLWSAAHLRVQATEALGRLGSAALPQLEKLANDDGPDIDRQWAAVRALHSLNRRPRTERGRVLLALDANDQRGMQVVALWLKLLPYPRAFQSLGELRDPSAVKMLITFLGGEHHQAATEALVQILPDPPARSGVTGFHAAPTTDLCRDAVLENTGQRWINSSSQCFPAGDGQNEGYYVSVDVDRSRERGRARTELLRRALQLQLGASAIVAAFSQCDNLHRLNPKQAGNRVSCAKCGTWFDAPS